MKNLGSQPFHGGDLPARAKRNGSKALLQMRNTNIHGKYDITYVTSDK